ncbi:MAG: MlaC/ttg2D family ABC transporter substrate-binding protein [Bdellovibrionales bacterium]
MTLNSKLNSKKGRFILTASLLCLSACAGVRQPSYAFMPAAGQSGAAQGVAIQISDSIQQGAEAFVQKTADQGIGFLSDSNLSAAKKKQSFQKLLQNNFDMKTIGRFALGRYWNVASDAERAEYQKLFNAMIVEVYSRRFGDYTGESLEVRSSRQDSASDVTVTSFIVPKSGQDIQLDWSVRYKNGSYRVVDVKVEGVSMALTQRSEFASVIQRGGGQVAVLLDHLRGQNSPVAKVRGIPMETRL